MNITEYLENGKYILPDDPKLQYCGRIGRGDNGMPEMVFPCSFIKWRFKGDSAAMIVNARRFYFDVFAGCFIDGVQYTVKLEPGMSRIELMRDNKVCCGQQMYLTRLYENTGLDSAKSAEADAGKNKKVPMETVAGKIENAPMETAVQNGKGSEHEIMFFKRQDACNFIEICGIELNEGAELLGCAPLPELKMEVYGDSVSAGEVSEALYCAGKPDPEGHEGLYSNSWYSYSWIAARKLNAQLHDIAQGGIPLLDGTGWYGSQEDLIGMESIYDKTRYSTDRKNSVKWDFSSYIPDVVVIAFGQNDAHPDDFMKILREAGCDGDDSESMEIAAARKKSDNWKKHYAGFLKQLRTYYPNALIICTTTILCHDSTWDDAIGEAVDNINDPKIRHFLYSKNGSGTPGHIRANEAEEMAEELTGYIKIIMQIKM
ncbi:MAG: electron transporter RnfD [Lachnospiraceae bacterium]|nr:electron transporter RnfD [Lachnospiraceae bacterium]